MLILQIHSPAVPGWSTVFHCGRRLLLLTLKWILLLGLLPGVLSTDELEASNLHRACQQWARNGPGQLNGWDYYDRCWSGNYWKQFFLLYLPGAHTEQPSVRFRDKKKKEKKEERNSRTWAVHFCTHVHDSGRYSSATYTANSCPWAYATPLILQLSTAKLSIVDDPGSCSFIIISQGHLNPHNNNNNIFWSFCCCLV